MRSILLLAFLTALSSPVLAAETGDACKGELWRKVRDWLGPQKTFEDTVAFLQKQGVDYAVFDARSEGEDQTGPLSGATDCQPRKEAPQCSIVLSEPLPGSKPSAASPTTVELDEIISIDFDAKGKQTGHGCEVVETGA